MVSFDVARRPAWLRPVAFLIALSLGVAACGSGDGETSAAPTLAPAAEGNAPDSSEPDAASDEAGSTDSNVAEGTASEDSADAPAAEPAVNLFPDVDVLNVSDGSTINLAAELGGGDKATLLWFWAPH
jgi:hypothetical protein